MSATQRLAAGLIKVRPLATATVILLRTQAGDLLAYRNACPHMGIELDREPKRLMTPSGRHLRCTGHGALFEPDTGLCVRGPCVNETLMKLPIHIEGRNGHARWLIWT
jgi:nitrite reductase/ring-hydroxylating ferredoxin subunit